MFSWERSGSRQPHSYLLFRFIQCASIHGCHAVIRPGDLLPHSRLSKLVIRHPHLQLRHSWGGKQDGGGEG